MATKKDTKRRLDKETRYLIRAVRDLSQIFTQKELSKRFKITPSQIRYYKQYRKRKPLPKRKREAIIRFYGKLKDRERKEDYRYHYVVVKRRIKKGKDIIQRQTLDLIEEIGAEKLAKKIGVKPETIIRWSNRRVGRLRKEHRRRLYRLHSKLIKNLVGLFVIQREFKDKKERKKKYNFIEYHGIFKGTEIGFESYILGTKQTEIEFIRAEIIDSLIRKQGKFSVNEAKKFISHLGNVPLSFFAKSKNACYEFIVDNFTGKDKSKLLKELEKYESPK